MSLLTGTVTKKQQENRETMSKFSVLGQLPPGQLPPAGLHKLKARSCERSVQANNITRARKFMHGID